MNTLNRIISIIALSSTTLIAMDASAHYSTKRTVTAVGGSPCWTVTANVGRNRDLVFAHILGSSSVIRDVDDGGRTFKKISDVGTELTRFSYNKNTGMALGKFCMRLGYVRSHPWIADENTHHKLQIQFTALDPGIPNRGSYVRTP